jgi:hypothetical protein
MISRSAAFACSRAFFRRRQQERVELRVKRLDPRDQRIGQFDR